MSFTDDSGLNPEPEGQVQGDPGNQPPPAPPLSGYAQNYLQSVPEAERELVTRHISQWDKGASTQFQRYADELNQWKGLGKYDELVEANTLYRQFMNNPQEVIDYLYKEHGYSPSELAAIKQAQQTQATQPGQQGAPEIQPWETPLKEINGKFSQFERALGGVAEWIKEQKTAAENAQYDKQVDDLLSQVKKVDSTVPDDYALTMMLKGASPEQAAAQWKQNVQATINRQANGQPSSAPGLMGSGSHAPIAQKSTDMTEEQRRQALFAAVGQAFGE